jgi:hypothetical protein
MKPVYDQQPIARTIGRRQQPPVGKPPDAGARAAWNAMAIYRTRAPKGVYIYANHEEMARDREQWDAEAIAERTRARG